MEASTNLRRLNIGCGATPTPGWVNYDNSISIRLADWEVFTYLLGRFGLLSDRQKQFICIVKQKGIRYADAVKKIPEPDHTIEVVYACHMLEHLDRCEAALFLKEARRVLVKNGIIRIAVPDLRYHINIYLNDRNADELVESLQIARPKPDGLIGKLKHLLIGERHHLWMYDGESLCRLLLKSGFCDPRVLDAGETIIPNPDGLDLAERAPESVFVEAINPR
jgi:SAM-dependent methyltransferase